MFERITEGLTEQQRAVCEQILAGNWHTGRRLRTVDLGPVAWDALAERCLSIAAHRPSSDVTAQGHVTNWTDPAGEARQWSLFNRNGKTQDTSSDHDRDATGKRFAHDELALPLLAGFPTLYNLRLNMLGPSSYLRVHEEELIVRVDDAWRLRARFHLPIQTNPQAEVVLDGHRFHFEAGHVYWLNNGCHHAASNMGTEPRLHLVWDCLLDADLCERIANGTSVAKVGTSQVRDSRTEGKRTPEQVGALSLG